MRNSGALGRIGILAVAAWLALGPVATAGPLDKDIKVDAKETELQALMKILATQLNVNILVDPQEAKRKVTVSLKNVNAKKALEYIAKLNKLELRFPEEGKEDLLVIARSDTLQSAFDQALSKTFQLRYASAVKMANILQKALAKSGNVQIEVDERTNSLIVSGTQALIDGVDKLQKELDKPVPQVLIDSKIVSVTTNVLKDIGFNWEWGTKGEADGTVTGQGGSGPFFAFTERFRINNNQNFFLNAPANDAEVLKFGDFYRGNFFFDAVFRALETASIARNLASPRVLAVNGAKAQLRIGDEIVFSGGPSQGPESKETGIVLDVEPRINKDGFITMDVSVEQSTATFRASDFPTINKTNAKTTVQVRDGEEVLIGGLVTESDNQTEEKIPFLSDIPVIKHFFQRKRSSPNTTELVILMTPRVIKQNLPGVGEVGGGGGGGGDPGGFDDDLSLGGPGGGDKPKPGGGGDKPKPKPGDDDLGFDDDDFGF